MSKLDINFKMTAKSFELHIIGSRRILIVLIGSPIVVEILALLMK